MELPAPTSPPARVDPLFTVTDDERAKTLVEHLSREITAQVESMTSWRSHVNFTAYFGPWILVGGYVALEHVTLCKPDLSDPWVRIFGVSSIATYMGLGYGCARVERNARKQCNKWRGVIANLCADKPRDIDAGLIEFPHKLIRSYLGVYGLMLVAFVSWAGLVMRCTETKSKASASAEKVVPGGSVPVRITPDAPQPGPKDEAPANDK